MSGVLRLGNTGAGTGRSTLEASASNDQTFTLPSAGGTLLTSNTSIPGGTITLDGADVNITNGDLNVDNGTLFVDESTNRVGIGTTSPKVNLDLVGTTTSAFRIRSLATASRGFEIWNDSNTDEAYISNYYGGPIIFQTNNTERMRIDSSGRLGLGTSSPVESLHLGGSSAQNIRINGNTNAMYLGTVGDTTQVAVNRRPTDGTIPNSARGTAFINVNGLSTGGSIELATSTAANTSATTAVTIDSSQRVGIGVTGPQGPLDVATTGGRVQIYPAINATGTRIFSANTTGTDASAFELSGSQILFTNVTNTPVGQFDASGRLLVGTSNSNGAANNTAPVVAGNFKTRSGLQALLNNTATTVLTFDSDSIAFYLVHAALSAGDTTNYAAVSLVAIQGTSAKITNLMTANLLFITLSGNDLQLRQTAGGTAGVYWSITRTMLA